MNILSEHHYRLGAWIGLDLSNHQRQLSENLAEDFLAKNPAQVDVETGLPHHKVLLEGVQRVAEGGQRQLALHYQLVLDSAYALNTLLVENEQFYADHLNPEVVCQCGALLSEGPLEVGFVLLDDLLCDVIQENVDDRIEPAQQDIWSHQGTYGVDAGSSTTTKSLHQRPPS